ncbi:ABC transporter permease [Rhizobium terrae]|uniref:ABC transporter permease n=1 Tax=Rhizobium terrae TaxID=2171756 RepID=UPI000E3E4E13|nr:ABC transporter permease [Rhizobium terrae]
MGRHLNPSLSVAGVVAFVVLWQIVSSTIIDPFFLPPPSDIVLGSSELVADGTLATSILISLMRILAGWLLGSAIAIPLGLMVGISQTARAVVDPFIHFFRFIPAIALVTLFIVWFGVGEISKILLIAYATAFIVMVNTASGVSAIPVDKLDAARCLGARPSQLFREIVIPASIPSIYVGMRLALASSFLVIVAAEMLAAESGLGYIIWTSRLYFRIDWMFAAIVALGLLGYLTDRSWKIFGRRLLKRYLRDTIKY